MIYIGECSVCAFDIVILTQNFFYIYQGKCQNQNNYGIPLYWKEKFFQAEFETFDIGKLNDKQEREALKLSKDVCL